MTGNSATTIANTTRCTVINFDAKKALLAVNFFVETNRMEIFLAVYFITFKGWSAVQIGILSLASNIVMIAFQTPAGDLLDKSSKKKVLMVVSLIVASITTASVGWISEFWIVLVIKMIEGLAATVFLPGLLSLLLGICLTKEETPKFIASCEVSNKIGSVVFILGSAIISHFLYPDIASVFYLLGAGGLVGAFFVMMIPVYAINNDRARQSTHEGGSKGDKETTDATTYCQLLKDRNIFFFAVLTFIYHLGNASVAPIVAQFLAIDNERAAMVFASATMLISFFVQGITAYLIMHALDFVSAKSLLVLAHFVFPLRCGLLAIMTNSFDNKFAICGTQILDGIGAGLYDTMVPIVVSKMTGDTGRFGFTFGFIVTTWRLGHGFSLMLGQSILHVSSYEVTFITQGVIGIASLVLLILCVHIPDDIPTDNQKETITPTSSDESFNDHPILLSSQSSNEKTRRSSIQVGSMNRPVQPSQVLCVHIPDDIPTDNQEETITPTSSDESFNDHPILLSSQSSNEKTRRSSIQVGSMNRPVQPIQAKRRSSIQVASVYRRKYSSSFDLSSENILIHPDTGRVIISFARQYE